MADPEKVKIDSDPGKESLSADPPGEGLKKHPPQPELFPEQARNPEMITGAIYDCANQLVSAACNDEELESRIKELRSQKARLDAIINAPTQTNPGRKVTPGRESDAFQ